jgi:hypothetical protein
MMQRYMPILFAIIYINIAAGVNVYFIVSSLCRIGIQAGVFHSGLLGKPAPVGEQVLPARGGRAPGGRRPGLMERLADAQKRALEQQAQQQRRRAEIERTTGTGGGAKAESAKGPTASVPRKPKPGPSASVPKPRPSRSSNGASQKPSPSRKSPNGASAAGRDTHPPDGTDGNGRGNGVSSKDVAPSPSRDKRGRRAR